MLNKVTIENKSNDELDFISFLWSESRGSGVVKAAEQAIDEAVENQASEVINIERAESAIDRVIIREKAIDRADKITNPIIQEQRASLDAQIAVFENVSDHTSRNAANKTIVNENTEAKIAEDLNKINQLVKKEEELFPAPRINPGILKDVLNKYVQDAAPATNQNDDLEETLIEDFEKTYQKRFSELTPQFLESISKRSKYKKIIKAAANKPVYIYPLISNVKQKTQNVKQKTVATLSPNPWAAQLSATCFIALFLSIYVARLAPGFSDSFTRAMDGITIKPIYNMAVMANNYINPENNMYKKEISASSETGKMMLGSYIKENSDLIAKIDKSQSLAVNENEIIDSYGNYYPGVVVLGISYPEEEKELTLLESIGENINNAIDKLAQTQVQISLYLHNKITNQ